MAIAQETRPVEDSVPKVNDEVAVGEDLDFQRRWWRIERMIWVLFTVLIVLDLLGCFGRGPLAKGHLKTQEGSLELNYERIERYGTPSVMTVQFGTAAVKDKHVHLWVSESLVKALGNQRIIPQPETSVDDEDGISYTFRAGPNRPTIEFALQPNKIGAAELKLRVPDSEVLTAKILVMP